MGRKNKNARPVFRYRTTFHRVRFSRRNHAGDRNGFRCSNGNGQRITLSGGSGLITAATPESHYPRRGDIWFADLGRHPGTSVQAGCRPVLVISNDAGNAHADTINVLPMTSQIKKLHLPCHVRITPDMVSDAHQPFWESMTLAEQITTVSRYALRSYVGRVEDKKAITAIDRSIADQLGLLSMQRVLSVAVPHTNTIVTTEEENTSEC